MRMRWIEIWLLAAALTAVFAGGRPAMAAKIDESKLRNDYRELLSDYGEWHSADSEFALTDMDNDGIRELIIAFTADDGEYQFDFYHYEDDGAGWVGSYERYADLYTPKRGKGLLAVIDRGGRRTVERLTVDYDAEEEIAELGIMEDETSSRAGEDFPEGYQVIFNNVELFLEGGEKLSVVESSEYLIPGSDSRYIDESDLAGMDAAQLRKARNEIYARRGRKFASSDLQKYFEKQSWYRGRISPDDFDESVFNKYENANIAFILAVENGEISEDDEVEFDDSWYETWHKYALTKSKGKGADGFEIFSDDDELELAFGDGESMTMPVLCDTENSNGSYTYNTTEGPMVVYWPGRQNAVQIVGSEDRDGYYYPVNN